MRFDRRTAELGGTPQRLPPGKEIRDIQGLYTPKIGTWLSGRARTTTFMIEAASCEAHDISTESKLCSEG